MRGTRSYVGTAHPLSAFLRDAPAGRAEWHFMRVNTTHYQDPVRDGETAVAGDDVKRSEAHWNQTREPREWKSQRYHCTTMTERINRAAICE